MIYRTNVRPPEPHIRDMSDVERYEMKLKEDARRQYANVRLICTLLIALVTIAVVLACAAVVADAASECSKRGGVLVSGACLQEVK